MLPEILLIVGIICVIFSLFECKIYAEKQRPKEKKRETMERKKNMKKIMLTNDDLVNISQKMYELLNKKVAQGTLEWAIFRAILDVTGTDLFTDKKIDNDEPLYYLYGKHICSLQWVMVGQFNYDDAQDFMDNTEYGEHNKEGMYVGFYLTTERVDL